MLREIKLAIPLLLSLPALAQENLQAQAIEGALDTKAVLEELRQSESRELNVLAPTIAPEEIDRAVLNRLMQEIARDPDTSRARLDVSDTQLQDIFIALSNARSFINGSEMANIRAMCRAYNDSELDGDARIQQALDAYKARAKFTTDFIARYYGRVLSDIQAGLSEISRTRFDAYMEDRRRRMANAGIVTLGAVVENISSGTETVQFHCRR
ncbi:MAG TPA: hypothetical protein DCM64_10710 [Gammaproteobacteria bacterium]|jgi:hypothetical protein|nr:hypothetical protein [Gammaproteobacteria bacterium]MDP6732854.1 hypothetical protein [Gammaproteobacteria bacterium]HAJ76913.1 hypothetical protein [Gammaproteobacteria bacterium]|tara:strand:- start:496 stop:1131 length:636 start_codon:yes stop_codon:yes gene_type:complete